jgi:hypothetical protein
VVARFLQSINIASIGEQLTHAVSEAGSLLEERARSGSNFALVHIHILEQYKPTTPFLLGKILVGNLISCCFICRLSASFVYQQAMLAFYAVVRYLDAFTRDLGLRCWASGR